MPFYAREFLRITALHREVFSELYQLLFLFFNMIQIKIQICIFGVLCSVNEIAIWHFMTRQIHVNFLKILNIPMSETCLYLTHLSPRNILGVTLFLFSLNQHLVLHQVFDSFHLNRLKQWKGWLTYRSHQGLNQGMY